MLPIPDKNLVDRKFNLIDRIQRKYTYISFNMQRSHLYYLVSAITYGVYYIYFYLGCFVISYRCFLCIKEGEVFYGYSCH